MLARRTAARARFSKGQEVVYVGQERQPRIEPFNSAEEIWVESDAAQTEEDLYLFSCRMRDGRWEMSQPGYGRDFQPKPEPKAA